jgi:hypothetical protein
MKAVLIAAALMLPAVALAQANTSRDERSFRERVYERYCEKLRESPERTCSSCAA